MDAIHAYGTLLKREDPANPGTYVTVAKVGDIKGPNLKADIIEQTTQDSVNGWKEKLPTLLEAGAVTFEVFFIPTDDTQDAQVGMIKDMTGRLLRNFKMVFPDGAATTWSFAAYVAGVVPDASLKDALKAAVTLEITGQPTLA